MGIWKTQSVEQQPILKMTQWQVFEIAWDVAAYTSASVDSAMVLQTLRNIGVDTSDPKRPVSRHLVGYAPANREGRVSTAIQVVDARKREIRTSSGRTYVLVGRPGRNSDAAYVWDYWLSGAKVLDCKNMTADIARLFEA